MTKRGELVIRQPDSLAVVQPLSSAEKFVTPSADIIEASDEYIVTIEMPGARKETIKVSVDGDIMTVRSLINLNYGVGGSFHRNELMRANYKRKFHLGNGVNRSKISAEYLNGVLTIKLKKSDNFKSKEITIK